MTEPDPSLIPSVCIDSDHPAIIAFAADVAGHLQTPRDKAVALYYAVRDRIRYDPYQFDLSDCGLAASTTLLAGRGWCVPKATLLAAVCRAAGVPARVGYADVRNHLSTERLTRMMQTDVFHWHGYTTIRLDGRWVKATPAFNIELCEKFRLLPLEFDGTADSIYHPFDQVGNRHMEYLAERGEFDDVPAATIRAEFARLYPRLLGVDLGAADFAADVTAETAAR